MGIPIIELVPPVRPETTRAVDIVDVVQLLGSIVSSVEPAVVFLSVAQLFAPLVCSTAVVAITESDDRSYKIAVPRERSTPTRQVGVPRGDQDAAPAAITAFGGITVTRDTVVTEIHGLATATHSAYRGALAMTFPRRDSAHALLGQLVVDRAVALVTIERLGDAAEIDRERAANLTTALRSNRDIGIALGIIMSRHRMTEAQAFDLLRCSSQETQRKLRDVAQDVARTGEIDFPARVSTTNNIRAGCRPSVVSSTPMIRRSAG